MLRLFSADLKNFHHSSRGVLSSVSIEKETSHGIERSAKALIDRYVQRTSMNLVDTRVPGMLLIKMLIAHKS